MYLNKFNYNDFLSQFIYRGGFLPVNAFIVWSLFKINYFDIIDNDIDNNIDILKENPNETFLCNINGYRNTYIFKIISGIFYYAIILTIPLYAYNIFNETDMTNNHIDNNILYMFTNIINNIVSNKKLLNTLWILTIFIYIYMIQNIFGLLIYPPTWKIEMKKIEHDVDNITLVFRYCTRGDNPNLVSYNCKKVYDILKASELKKSSWILEVVTDKPLNLNTIIKDIDVLETVVPDTFICLNGSKFKARALHYALLKSEAKLCSTDWICHLDEETYFDTHTINAIYNHCISQNKDVKSGIKEFPNIGQGMIMYNTFCTKKLSLNNVLLDTIRTVDDIGIFRLYSYLFKTGYVGIHGSFLMINYEVEKNIGFDFGANGSICEDTYFYMCAKQKNNIGINWIDACMYEQSPFTMMDFIKQRARWFHGLFYCTPISGFNLKDTFILSIMMISWTTMILFSTLSQMLIYGNLYGNTQDKILYKLIRIFNYFLKIKYCIGFVHNFSPYIENWDNYFVLYYLLNNNMMSILELLGVLYGISLVILRKSVFHVVQKE